MKSRLHFTLLCLFTTCFFSISQTNYRDGYVIGLNNDTVMGMIDFKLDEENMHAVRFIPKGEEKVHQYFPGEIIGYRLVEDGKYYVSKEIKIEKNYNRVVFVEFLVQGLKNLYYYKLNLRDFYLIEDDSGKLIVLSKKPDSFDNLRVVEDLKYKGVLKYVFKEYELVHKQTDKAKFDRKDMIRLTRDYHNNVCLDGSECIIFENDYTKKFAKFYFAFYAGLHAHTLMFYTMYQNRDKDLFVNSIVPELGSQVSVFFPRFNPSLGFFAEVSCSQLQGKLENFELNTLMSDTYNVYEHSAFRINSILGVKYVLDLKKIRPVLEVGIAGGYMINSANQLRIYDMQQSSTIPYIEQDDLFLPDRSRIGYSGAFQLDYELNNGDLVFAKVGYYNTVAINSLAASNSTYNNKIEYAFQFKVGYMF